MLSHNYHRLPVVEFGRQLLESGDLDPIYVALQRLDLPSEQLARWLMAYWLFYTAGFASYASEHEGKAYWELLKRAAENATQPPVKGRWPRGSERRHFRGAVAVKAVAHLCKQYREPESFVDYLTTGSSDLASVMGRVKEHYLFGEWIAFKVADMLDAVLKIPVEQSDLTLFLYDTPRKSIIERWNAGDLPLRAKTTEKALEEAFHWLQKQLSGISIPHKPKLTVPDWFVLETVWCKHKSHLSGHYPLYKDISEISHAARDWSPVSDTARQFLRALPRQAGCLM